MPELSLKQKTKAGLLWSSVGQFATYGVQFIVGVSMARLLTPSDYGITALPAVFMAIAMVLVESGFNSALVRKPDLTESDMTTAFLYCISVGFLCYIALFFTSPLIAKFYNEPILTPLVRVTALTFLWSPFTSIQNVKLQRTLNFKTLARITFVNAILSGIVGLSVAYMGYGLWALVASGLASSIFSLIQATLASRWFPKEKWSRNSFKYLWGYGNKLVGTNLISNLYANVGPIILGKFGGAAILGNYNRAKGYASLPALSITGIINNVTFPVLSKLLDNRDALANAYRRMIRGSAFVVFPIMMLIAALAEPLVITLITEKWRDCIVLLKILCVVFMWQPVHILNVNIMQVAGRTDWSLKLELIKRPISLIIVIIGLQFGAVGYCWADFVVSMMVLFLNTYFTGKLTGVRYFEQLKDLIPIWILSTIMFLLVLLVNSFISNYIIQLFVGGVVGAVFYLGISYLFKFKELDDLKFLLKRN